jgi:hypothetical protein
MPSQFSQSQLEIFKHAHKKSERKPGKEVKKVIEKNHYRE